MNTGTKREYLILLFPDTTTKPFSLYRAAWPIAAILLAVFVGGLMIAESPKQARDRRFDDRLVSNFYQIDSILGTYYERNKKLWR